MYDSESDTESPEELRRRQEAAHAAKRQDIRIIMQHKTLSRKEKNQKVQTLQNCGATSAPVSSPEAAPGTPAGTSHASSKQSAQRPLSNSGEKQYEESKVVPKFYKANKESGDDRKWFDIDIAKKLNTQRPLYSAMYDEARCRDDAPLVVVVQAGQHPVSDAQPPNVSNDAAHRPDEIIDNRAAFPDPTVADFNADTTTQDAYAGLMNRIIKDELRRINLEMPSAGETTSVSFWRTLGEPEKPRKGVC